MLKVHEKTVYRLAAEERLPAFKVGGSRRFRAEDLDNWFAEELITLPPTHRTGDRYRT